MFTTSGTYPWLSVTQIFHNGQPIHGGDRKTFEVHVITGSMRLYIKKIFLQCVDTRFCVEVCTFYRRHF